MKVETLEEFLARGGEIKKIPYQPPAEPRNSIKTNSSPENRILSLDDGAFYFAENRSATKEIKQVCLKDVVDNYNLPKDIVDRLKGAVDGK